jgi:hypothetical protein
MTVTDESQAAQAEPPPADDPDGSVTRSRRIVTGLLVIVTSLSIVLASLGVWAHNVLLNTDKFMETVEPALQDPALYSAVSDYVSTQTLEALDLETRISTALAQLDDFLFGAFIDALGIEERGQALLDSFDRPSLEDLAPTVASGLEDRITTRINNVVTSPELRSRLPELVRAGHTAVIALLRDDFAEIPNVSVVEGEVRLNVVPIIGEVIRQVLPDLSGLGSEITLPDRFSDQAAEARQQLEEAIGAKLPDDFGQVTVMSEDQLTELQDGVILLDRMMWALVAFALILLVVTLVTSKTRRRTTIQLAVGVVVGLLLGVALLRWVQTQITSAIVDPSNEKAAGEIIHNVFSGLRQGAVWVAVAAVVLGIAAYLSGRPAWAVRTKDGWDHLTDQGPGGSIADQWVSARYDLVRGVGIAVAVVAIWLLGLSVWTVLIVGAVLAIFLWAVSTMRTRAAAPAEEEVSV